MLPDRWQGVYDDAEALLRTHAALQPAAPLGGVQAAQAQQQQRRLAAQLRQQALDLLNRLSTVLSAAMDTALRQQASHATHAAATAAAAAPQRVAPMLRGRKADAISAAEVQVAAAAAAAGPGQELDHGARQQLLQRLAPAMQALYTIDDDAVVLR